MNKEEITPVTDPIDEEDLDDLEELIEKDTGETEAGDEIREIVVEDQDAGKRLDAWCAEQVDTLSRSRIKELIGEEDILVEGKKAKASQKLKAGQNVTIRIRLPKPIEAVPQDLPVEIVYEDEDVCVVNKEQGMVVHPAHGTPDGTLVNALLYHLKDLSGVGGELRPGIVHRIDKDTSGLLLIAKNDNAHQKLSEQFKDHSITREYVALVKGIVPNNSGKIDMPIGRDPKDRKKMAVTDRNSKHAVTHFEVLERYAQGYTLCKFKLETGRTHQIRVHLKAIGHPIIGDPLYNPESIERFGLARQALHASDLTLPLLKKGSISLKADLPEDLCKLELRLRG